MKCLISDFDGTLYDNNFINNLKSIKEFIDDGNIFVVATGRTFKNIKKKIVEAGIPYNYLICNNGLTIFDDKNNLIYSQKLNVEDILFFLKYIIIKAYKYQYKYV